MAKTTCPHCGQEHVCHVNDDDQLTFTVTITGMDLAAWAIDFGLDNASEARADFATFARSNLQGSVDELLHRMGYHDQQVDVH
ncbi:hypothetical protein SEA_REINDEER_140 [Mycobacterium phage Reindeer]|uniref:Uncharacterized protein n=1 Tax=Mycobacterium phage Reindeer TaxID=2762283 RepID=A0A7G8LI59_9CAUD|nr:hypothetical protein J4U05_gp112 [Mycobacterium phage Reindeer]QNJ56931.1 hypothetical protein SEA_REINDEER_140 [Mycobacterium phage Reindeer]